MWPDSAKMIDDLRFTIYKHLKVVFMPGCQCPVNPWKFNKALHIFHVYSYRKACGMEHL